MNAPPKDNPITDRLRPLTNIMKRLREPGGCPWDREQDYSTLAPYVLEEAYEVVAAIDSGDKDNLREELGDLLFQVIFLSRLAEEEGEFDIGDVIDSCVEKMTRRHPHVFADTECTTSADVLKSWNAIKESEKIDKAKKSNPNGQVAEEGYLGDVPAHLPALMHAHKISKKAAKTGFDWAGIKDVVAKIDEELNEFKRALEAKDRANMEEELGDLLFSVANTARFVEINPEEALRKTIGKFINRFHFIERELKKDGKSLFESSLQEMEALWEISKKRRKQDNTAP